MNEGEVYVEEGRHLGSGEYKVKVFYCIPSTKPGPITSLDMAPPGWYRPPTTRRPMPSSTLSQPPRDSASDWAFASLADGAGTSAASSEFDDLADAFSSIHLVDPPGSATTPDLAASKQDEAADAKVPEVEGTDNHNEEQQKASKDNTAATVPEKAPVVDSPPGVETKASEEDPIQGDGTATPAEPAPSQADPSQDSVAAETPQKEAVTQDPVFLQREDTFELCMTSIVSKDTKVEDLREEVAQKLHELKLLPEEATAEHVRIRQRRGRNVGSILSPGTNMADNIQRLHDNMEICAQVRLPGGSKPWFRPPHAVPSVLV